MKSHRIPFILQTAIQCFCISACEKKVVNEQNITKVLHHENSVTVRFENKSTELENSYKTLFYGEFGYTLIGQKPVSIEDEIENLHLYFHPEVLNEFFVALQAAVPAGNLFRVSKKFLP